MGETINLRNFMKLSWF